eukprot:828970-Pyramimonas_sp.AAC.1
MAPPRMSRGGTREPQEASKGLKKDSRRPHEAPREPKQGPQTCCIRPLVLRPAWDLRRAILEPSWAFVYLFQLSVAVCHQEAPEIASRDVEDEIGPPVKRRRIKMRGRGISADFIDQRQRPNGPSSIKELFDWPHVYTESILARLGQMGKAPNHELTTTEGLTVVLTTSYV